MPDSTYSALTGGLYTGSDSSSILGGTQSCLAASGYCTYSRTDLLNPGENSNPTSLSNRRDAALASAGIDPSILTAQQTGTTLIQAGGSLLPVVQPLGSGYSASFDPTTQLGKILPAFSSLSSTTYGGGFSTFTGSDILVMIQATNGKPGPGNTQLKKLTELHTLTISVHRESAAVRALGYINPKGFGRGTRTIAGTLILTPENVDVLYEFLQPGLQVNLSKDSFYSHVDQIPPLDFTIFFVNEEGYASYRNLVGVQFVTDGEVYSVHDMMIERTISYVAMDFTPLLPVTVSSLFTNPSGSPAASYERTPTTLMSGTPDPSGTVTT